MKRRAEGVSVIKHHWYGWQKRSVFPYPSNVTILIHLAVVGNFDQVELSDVNQQWQCVCVLSANVNEKKGM